MSTIQYLQCDVCTKKKLHTSGWWHLERRYDSTESYQVEIAEQLDICSPKCFTRWIGEQEERRRHYSPRQRWDVTAEPEGWE